VKQLLNQPYLFYFVNALVWGLLVVIIYYSYKNQHFVKQGITNIKLKINRKVHINKMRQFLVSKMISHEERLYGEVNDVVKVTYTDHVKQDWGGPRPDITFEYDERNSFLLCVTVSYNRREAKQALVCTADDLRSKIIDDLNSCDVWDVAGEDKSREDLAADKRAAIEVLLLEDAEADDNKGAGLK